MTIYLCLLTATLLHFTFILSFPLTWFSLCFIWDFNGISFCLTNWCVISSRCESEDLSIHFSRRKMCSVSLFLGTWMGFRGRRTTWVCTSCVYMCVCTHVSILLNSYSVVFIIFSKARYISAHGVLLRMLPARAVPPVLLVTSPAQVWTNILLVQLESILPQATHPLLLSFHFSDTINIHVAFRSMGHCWPTGAKNQQKISSCFIPKGKVLIAVS